MKFEYILKKYALLLCMAPSHRETRGVLKTLAFCTHYHTPNNHFPFFFFASFFPPESSSPRRAASIFSLRAPSPVMKSVNFWNSWYSSCIVAEHNDNGPMNS